MAKPRTAAKGKPKPKTKTPAKTPVKKTRGNLVRQPHGGAINQGPALHPVAGPGRPRDEVREKLLRIADGKGIRFLAELMDGRVTVRLDRKCQFCKKTAKPLSVKELGSLVGRIGATVDQRLKGLDQTFRYGVGTKDELDVRSHPEIQRFVMIHARATREIAGIDMYERIAERVRELAA